MKKIWLICCLLIGVTAVNYAQGTYRTTDTTDKAKGLQKQLKLTDEQTAKIAAIYQSSAQQCERIIKAERGSSAKMGKSIRPLRAGTIKKIEGVLTPDQAAKYDVLIKHTKKSGVDWGVECY